MDSGAGATAADAEGATEAMVGVSMGLAEDTVAEGTSSVGEGLGDAQAESARRTQEARRESIGGGI